MTNREQGIKLERKGVTGIVLTVLLLGIPMLGFNVQPVAAAHPWPMFRHDLKHTGRSPFIGAQTAQVKWVYPTGGTRSSPAIAEDGTIYVGSDDGNLYAINPDGTQKWSYPTGGNVYSSPAVGSDGTIYIASWRESGFCTGAVYAINPDGTLEWRYPDTGHISLEIESSPAIDPSSGVIYVGGACGSPWAGRMHAINPDGSLKWEFNPASSSGWITASPAMNDDGKILFGDYTNPDGIFYALNPDDGSIFQQRVIPNPSGEIDIHSSAAISSDGMIYFGGVNANVRLWALNPDLTVAWNFPTGGHVPGSPAIGPDGTIYVGSYDDKLYAINPDGTKKWAYTTDGDIYSSPAIGADGTIYFGTTNGTMYALNSDSTLKWSYTTGGAIYSSPAIGSDSTVYVGSYDGILYAFGPIACQVSPIYLDFGTVTLGSYLDKTFIITNIGEDMLTGTVSESCDHYSIVSGGGPYSLGAGESVTVTVRFEPTSLGQHNCTIETGNDLCGDVFCTGVGGSPCQVSPTSLSFGTVTVGSYLDKTFKITNIGGETLTGTVSESCDHYDIISGGGAYSLEPGDSIIVTVRFEPASPGQHNCTIETGNDLCSDVSCSGVGDVTYWYWKPPYDDYAPSGMPDIDQKQDNWKKEYTDQWTFCGPCAVANCFKWFDSKYNEGLGGWPGDGMDAFPLVRDYMDDLLPFYDWDDHDPWNVDHIGTEWNPGVGWPPETDQPFLPGPQPQPSPMPPWGELVERLAWYFDTDGIQTSYCSHAGTNILQMQQGIQDWLESEMFEDGSTLADTLCVAITPRPTFAYVESLVEKSENVILLLGFWYPGEAPIQQQFQEFIRGDFNEDGIIDLGDIILCLNEGPFSCDDAADADDDGMLDVGIEGADCDYLTDFYLLGGPPPPPPFPDCGTDPTPDELDCGSFALCGSWWRVGGHYVTVAGVNSIEQKIAVSDPFIDAAELGLAEGRVGDGWLIDHPWGSHDPTVHNDEGNVSHDMYVVDTSSISPGGVWWLPDYPASTDPSTWMTNFSAQNVPDEFVDKTQEWDEVSPIFTEVEYCIHVSPWDYRGDVNIPNGDGIVELGDIVFLINYVFKSGPAPVPYWEGDVNCDGVIELGDIVFLINYVFKNGPVPRCCDP